MSTQLISFRLRDEEVALLMQQADLEESVSLTAQRLIRQRLGTQAIPPDRLTALLTQVAEFQEQVESIKGFVDEAIDQHLSAINQRVDEAVNQHLQAELLLARRHFDELEERLDRYFQIQRQAFALPAQISSQSERSTELVNRSQELARKSMHFKTRHSRLREHDRLL